MNTNNRRMPRSEQIEELLVEQMRVDLTRPKWWHTIRGRMFFVAGVSVVLLGGAVAAVTLLDSRDVSDTAVVHCLDRDSRNLDGSLPGSAVSLATPEGVVAIDDAIAACKTLWAAGAFAGTDPLEPSPSAVDVPEQFTLCVTDTGAAAVVPGRVQCSVLKLHPYEG